MYIYIFVYILLTHILTLGTALVSGPRRGNVAHVRQSRPDCGLGSQAKVLKPLHVVPPSPGSRPGENIRANDTS